MSQRIAKLLVRRPRALLIVSAAAVAALAVYAGGVPEHLELGNGDLPGSPSERAAEALQDELGFDPEAAYMLLVETDGSLERDTVSVAVRALRSQISAVEDVARAGKAARSHSGVRTIAVYLEPDTPTDSALEAGRSLREELDPGPLRVSVAGDAAVSESARSTLLDEAPRLELVVLPFVIFLLVVALGWRLGLAALLGALLATSATVAALGLAAAIGPLYAGALPVSIVVAFVLSIALAAALERRYREEAGSLGKGEEALADSLGIVLRGALATAGAIVVLALATLTLEVGVAASIGVAALLATLLAPLSLLPVGAAIALGATRGEIAALPLVGAERGARDTHAAPRLFGATVAIARSRRRARAVLAALPAALALLLAVPLLDAGGIGVGAADLPADDDVRAAEAALAASFGAGVSGPLVVATESPADTSIVAGQRDSIAELPGVGDVSPAGNAASLARYSVAPASEPRSLAAQRTAGAIRALDLDGDPQLAGPAADLRDTGARLGSRLGLIGALALALVAALWALLFRAAFAAALALAATLGALAGAGAVVFVFSEGALEELLGYEAAGAPDLITPLMVAVIMLPIGLAGAGQLAAALREERVLGGGSAGALARSVTLTAAPALLAAACGLAISAAWLGSELTAAKEVGLGVGVGLLIEALLVRPLIAPALARLLWR